jgi:carbamoyl-phosphate synthase small subunit
VFGAETDSFGEVVFNTGMTGYQEMLTDPSYGGQIVVPTYPIIGNYGINDQDLESRDIQVAGFVVREHCLRPSHSMSNTTLHGYLESRGIAGISGVDTRAITRKIRMSGVMMGIITASLSYDKALHQLRQIPGYDSVDYVSKVSTENSYQWGKSDPGDLRPLILVSDLGVKYNILRILQSMNCRVVAVPAKASAKDILDYGADGIVISPGPGNPAQLDYVVDMTSGLIGKIPLLGICLGHQVIARALGGRTYKLKFGHRGANHPVKDVFTGRVHITAQNHGYAVDADSLPSGVEISHLNLNDGTVEGLRQKDMSLLSIQYHSEASPGPRDNIYIFERFLEMVG